MGFYFILWSPMVQKAKDQNRKVSFFRKLNSSKVKFLSYSDNIVFFNKKPLKIGFYGVLKNLFGFCGFLIKNLIMGEKILASSKIKSSAPLCASIIEISDNYRVYLIFAKFCYFLNTLLTVFKII